MEEYLQYMKTLRSQMNDVEDQAADVSVEEHMQLTTIQILEKDLNSGSFGRLALISTFSMGNKGNDARKNLVAMFESAKAKLDEILRMKSEVVIENRKMKQAIEQVNCRENDFKPELRAMDVKTHEEEYDALLSDKVGETEYLKSLQDQIEKLKGISNVVKCACGEEFKIEVDICV